MKIKIKEFWNKNKWNIIKVGIILSLLFICILLYNNVQNLQRQLVINEQNFIAINDSIRYEKQKNGELQASITSFIASEKQLKDLNRSLYDRIKRQEDRIISLNRSIIQLVQDTNQLRRYLVKSDSLINSILQIDENNYLAQWNLKYVYDSTNFDIFSGTTHIKVVNKHPLELIHLQTEMISRKTQIDLTWGQKIENGALRIFIQSAYPGFNVAQMEGVLIDPNTNPFFKDLVKSRRWFSGWSIGMGVSTGLNLNTGQWGLVIGPSIHYNIFNW